VGVARLARSLGCPVLALGGTLGDGAEAVLVEGIDAVFSICPGPLSLYEAVARAAVLLERAAEQAVRSFLAGWERAGRIPGPH
jgi:glycerate kinase